MGEASGCLDCRLRTGDAADERPINCFYCVNGGGNSRPQEARRSITQYGSRGTSLARHGRIRSMEEPIQERSAELSDREVEILRLVAEGLSNKEIAGRLFLSVNTVKVHLRNVFAKINVQSRTEATVYAIQQGLVVVPGATVGGDNGSAPTGEIAIAVPSITIEPPLPIGRRLALIGLAIISIGLALIARPPESVQSTSQAQPFSDSPSTGLPVRAAAGDTVWQAQSQMSLARGRLAVAAVAAFLLPFLRLPGLVVIVPFGWVLLAAGIAWLVLAAFRVGESGSWLLQDTVAVVVGGVGAIVIAVLFALWLPQGV